MKPFAERNQLLIGGIELIVNLAAMRIIDADDGGARFGLTVEYLPLGGDVSVHAAVTIQVVGTDIQQYRDVKRQRER